MLKKHIAHNNIDPWPFILNHILDSKVPFSLSPVEMSLLKSVCKDFQRHKLAQKNTTFTLSEEEKNHWDITFPLIDRRIKIKSFGSSSWSDLFESGSFDRLCSDYRKIHDSFQYKKIPIQLLSICLLYLFLNKGCNSLSSHLQNDTYSVEPFLYLALILPPYETLKYCNKLGLKNDKKSHLDAYTLSNKKIIYDNANSVFSFFYENLNDKTKELFDSLQEAQTFDACDFIKYVYNRSCRLSSTVRLESCDHAEIKSYLTYFFKLDLYTFDTYLRDYCQKKIDKSRT